MSITATTARSAIAAIIAAHSDAVVSVVRGGQTVDAVLSNSEGRGRADGFGEGGAVVRAFWCDASQLDRPENGETISVGGESVVVAGTKLDPMGALLKVDYIETNEVSGT